jgi:hypothetical protein
MPSSSPAPTPTSPTTSRRPNSARRASQSQPSHRRSFWARKDSTYETYILKTEKICVRKTGDHGMDTFSYDPSHLDDCEVPPIATKCPSKELLDVCTEWFYSEAAIRTALARIDAMNEDAPFRLDPDTTHRHILGSRSSDSSSTTSGAESTMSSFSQQLDDIYSAPETPMSVVSTPVNAHQKNAFAHHGPILPINMMGLESPPFTPLDSFTVNTPEPQLHATGTVPDLAQVSTKLSPLTFRSPLTFSPPGRDAFKNHNAWEHYLETIEEEFRDLNHNALSRMKGYGDVIRRLIMEAVIDGKLERDELRVFNEWYKTKVSVYVDLIYEMQKKTRATERELGGLRVMNFAHPT